VCTFCSASYRARTHASCSDESRSSVAVARNSPTASRKAAILCGGPLLRGAGCTHAAEQCGVGAHEVLAPTAASCDAVMALPSGGPPRTPSGQRAAHPATQIAHRLIRLCSTLGWHGYAIPPTSAFIATRPRTRTPAHPVADTALVGAVQQFPRQPACGIVQVDLVANLVVLVLLHLEPLARPRARHGRRVRRCRHCCCCGCCGAGGGHPRRRSLRRATRSARRGRAVHGCRAPGRAPRRATERAQRGWSDWFCAPRAVAWLLRGREMRGERREWRWRAPPWVGLLAFRW
jgi:hypothetical protein